MNKQSKTIKHCVLVAQSIDSDYKNANVFTKIASTPIIDFTLTWLAQNQIEQVFIFYSTSKNEVEQYLQKNQKFLELKIHPMYMKSSQLKSFGDVVREVQFRNIISQDFMIMFGDTITNVNLPKLISSHFKKKTQLKNVILTSVLQQDKSDKLHIINPLTSQILQMNEDDNDTFAINTQRVDIKKMNIEFRRDLVHCGIYICTVQILKIFKQTFENADMFDFIDGMLTSQVYTDKIVGYIASDTERAYRVNTAYNYYTTCLHYICRHLHPYTLFNRIKIAKGKRQEGKDFIVRNFNQILMRNSSIGRSASISNNVLIGYDTKVGDDCLISKSIIGNNCKIGNSTTLKNCIVLDNCQIEENAKYQNCLIEKFNESYNIKSYGNQIAQSQTQLITQELFIQSPENQEANFDEELENLLADKPEQETVRELYSVRKRFNKSLNQFTLEMMKKLDPKGKQGVRQFVDNWGQVIYELHGQEPLLLDSIFYVCQTIAKYEKGFVYFILQLYEGEKIGDYHLKKWYNEKIEKDSNNISLLSCKKFLESLQEDDDQDDDQDDD